MGEQMDMDMERDMEREQEQADRDRRFEERLQSEGVALDPRNAGKFDPTKYIRPIKGVPYLGVAPRLAWLRDVFPQSKIVQEHVKLDNEAAIFKTTVTAIIGAEFYGSAEAYGSCAASEFGAYIEKAATKSLGRALAALGFGTIESLEYDDTDGAENNMGQLADSPVARPQQRAPQRPDVSSTPQRAPQRPAAPSAGGGAGPSQAQVGKINFEARRVGLSQEDFNAMLVQVAGVDHMDKLTKQGASKVIEHLISQ